MNTRAKTQGKKTSEDVVERMLKLHSEGVAIVDIASIVGRTPRTVSSYVAKQLAAEKKQAPKPKAKPIAGPPEGYSEVVGKGEAPKPLPPATVDDAILAAQQTMVEQRAEMTRARLEGDMGGHARATRLFLAATQLLGRLASKEERNGFFVTNEEVAQAKATLLEKLSKYTREA